MAAELKVKRSKYSSGSASVNLPETFGLHGRS
jgi:hypothetical protein